MGAFRRLGAGPEACRRFSQALPGRRLHSVWRSPRNSRRDRDSPGKRTTSAPKICTPSRRTNCSRRAHMLPVYISGEAYLAAHQGTQAAAEFQKILDHPGVVANSPIGALAHLGLGRAYVLAGDNRQGQGRLRRFFRAVEGRRSRYPYLQASQSRILAIANTIAIVCRASWPRQCSRDKLDSPRRNFPRPVLTEMQAFCYDLLAA